MIEVVILPQLFSLVVSLFLLKFYRAEHNDKKNILNPDIGYILVWL